MTHSDVSISQSAMGLRCLHGWLAPGEGKRACSSADCRTMCILVFQHVPLASLSLSTARCSPHTAACSSSTASASASASTIRHHHRLAAPLPPVLHRFARW